MSAAAALLTAGLLPAVSPVAAAEPPVTPASVSDTRAEELLAKAASLHAGVQALTAEFTTTTVYPQPYRDTEERGTVTLARPGNVRVDITRYRRVRSGQPWEATGNGSLVVADGKTATTLVRHPESSQVRTEPTPASSEVLLRSLEPLAGFFTPVVYRNARYAGTQTWNGASYEVVRVEEAGGKRELYLDSNGWVQRVVVTRLSSAAIGRPVVREVSLRNVRRGVSLPADTFAFRPPSDALPVEKGRGGPGEGLLTVGEAAPDFTVQDKEGKPVRLSDFKGKTVVLKFWATWCWPCRQSLPETEALAKKYADKEVVVLAVALWDSPAAFKNWVAKNSRTFPGIRFAFDPAPQGKDIGTSEYRISTTPTTYILSPEGKISAAFAGYDGPSPLLEQAVQAAREKDHTRTAAALP